MSSASLMPHKDLKLVLHKSCCQSAEFVTLTLGKFKVVDFLNLGT